MNHAALLVMAMCAIPPGEIKTIIAVEADVVFRESLPSLPNDFGDKKPNGQAAETVEQQLPELWYWSHKDCVYCGIFERDYESNKEAAGFKPVKQTSQRPTWMPNTDPQFWWHTTEKQPTQKDVNNTKHQDGYPGWKVLASKFDNSRSPKKFERTKASFQEGQSGASVQPDRNASSRSRANTVSGYPESNTIWNIDGDWSPSKRELIEHLMSHEHAGRFDRNRLEGLDRDTLYRIHSAHHDAIGPTGKYRTSSGSGRTKRFLFWSWN